MRTRNRIPQVCTRSPSRVPRFLPRNNERSNPRRLPHIVSQFFPKFPPSAFLHFAPPPSCHNPPRAKRSHLAPTPARQTVPNHANAPYQHKNCKTNPTPAILPPMRQHTLLLI